MDWKLFLTVFGTILLAELGDKTQLATITFAATSRKPLAVFLAGSLALILTTLLGVVLGALLQRVVPVKLLHTVAAGAFIVIGVILLIQTLRGA